MHRHGHIVIVPGAGLHILVAGDVRFYVGSEGAVNDGGHFRPGQIALGVQEALVGTPEQAVLHRRGHGLGVPRPAVIVREVRRRLGSCVGPAGEAQAQHQGQKQSR